MPILTDTILNTTFSGDTVVRDAAREKQPAYFVHGGRPSRIMLDASFGDRADCEVVTPRTPPLKDFRPVAPVVPYGFWKLSDVPNSVPEGSSRPVVPP